MARAAGLYCAQGLNVDIINMNGGSKGAEELQAGRIDVMHVGLSSVVRVNQAGGDLRTIGSLSNVIRFTFFSAPGVKTAADLKGGVVGVSTFGSESDSTVTLALQKLGLTRDDVTIKEYGGGMKRLEAVKSGEIKATAINEPLSSLARAAGRQRAGRSRPGPDSVAVQRHRRAPRRHRARAAICSRASSRRASRAITSRSPTRSAPRKCWPRS